jgi:alpha-amylase
LPRDENLRETYRRLIAIRRAHPALAYGDHEGVQLDPDLLVFLRREPNGEAVAVAVNRGSEDAMISFEVPAQWSGRAVRDIWNEEPAAVAGDVLTLPISARSARILAVSELR